MAVEAELARLRAEIDPARIATASRTTTRMRVAVLHPQTAFVRGGAETHAEGLVRALRAAGHDADLVQIAGKWYPASQLAHQMAVWRSFDITESNGLKVDAVVGLKFPAYLVEHERKIVWLMHQHRTAYELWDHPVYADLSRQEDGAGGPGHGVERRPARAERGETRVHQLQEREGPAVDVAPHPGGGAVSPVARDGAPDGRAVRPARRLRRCSRAGWRA